ncbi:TIGR02996 domain-containing protein [Pyxidicoccus caerfyrddinensis]|uniref:TIGR02996 domain-containing protein n=1 Tax=Pyxidicoccus caerfyrddinensis TaxID=2709663 RepID=UPI0013DD7444|nr:TIGR02996 domain-containing protein [Pyxidicoccus caerfyrddinensis]
MADAFLTGLLELARSVFERGEEEQALRFLLEAWRETRSERLAGLVEKLSARLTAELPPLACEPHSSEMELRQPLDLPRMLESLLETANQGRLIVLREQLEALRKWPADPRLVPPLLAIASMPAAGNLWVRAALIDLFGHLRDSRTALALQALYEAPDGERYDFGRRGAFLPRVDASEPSPLDAEARALCRSLEEDLDAREEADASRRSLRKELLARVRARPEDDGARLVLADQLLEQGDPLGEFIALQCSPHPDEDRVKALLARHGMSWRAPLGPLADPDHTRFERGFPASVRLSIRRGQQVLPPPGPAWGTVREIDWYWESPPGAAAWLAHPHLGGVTRLLRMRDATARELGRYPLPVRSLQLRGGVASQLTEAFTLLAALPHLTCVDIYNALPDDVRLCATSPLAARLQRFTASVSGYWSLVVTPSAEVTVEATLLNVQRAAALADAIRAAVGFGTRALRVRDGFPPDERARLQLRSAASAYARVEWE